MAAYISWEKNPLNMLGIDILRNWAQKILGVLKGDFLGFGYSNDAQMPAGY